MYLEESPEGWYRLAETPQQRLLPRMQQRRLLQGLLPRSNRVVETGLDPPS